MTDGMGDNKSPDTVEEKKPLNEDQDVSLPAEELDSSKVKFINGGATSDSVVDIDGQTKVPERDFVGLTKEELLKYADDPFWVKVRWALLILFWVAWVGMLAAAITIIVLAPKCPPRPKLDWWQKSVMYQVYPRSFQDSDGDGVGDLKGIEQRLDYLRYKLNVTALWINPVYPSPNKDFGYDVADYTDIDPAFGSMEDFDRLKVAMHKKGMKLIMDFVPNHVSDQHEWFAKSKAKEGEYKDFFVWHAGKNSTGGGGGRPDPPNNWLSVFGDSAWTWDDARGEYYLHQFLPEQPDLNFRSEKVRDALKDVLSFWLAKGVDGFRVDAAAHLYEGDLNRDEPAGEGTGYDSLKHTLTTFQPETYETITEWRELTDSFGQVDGKPKFLLVEAYGSANQTMSFYSYKEKAGAHMPTNMNLLNLKSGCDAVCIWGMVQDWMTHMPIGAWANWALGNHDNSRLATRLGGEWVNPASLLLLTLPGTPIVYYGEEIGMHDVDLSFDQTRDPAGRKWGEGGYKEHSRDPQRTPMQWSGEQNAGFSSANATWLPLAQDYAERNVKAQLAHGAGVSNLEVFASLTALRQEPSFQWGLLEKVVVDAHVLSYVRQAEGFKGYLVAANFGEQPVTVDFQGASPARVPALGVVAAHTANFDSPSRAGDYAVGNVAKLGGVYLKPREAVVFWWEPHALAEE